MKQQRPIVFWTVDKLIPYEFNAKKHGPEQVAKIVAAIKNFGFGQNHAIAVDKNGVIINGHGRRLAALELGLKEVPVVVRDDLTPEQVRAYRLVDNKVAESQYDTELLSAELSELVHAFEFDMSEFFDARELDFAIEDLGEMDLDALTDNLASQVDEHSQKTQNSIDTENQRTVSITKALGFSQVTTGQQRTLARFLARAEGETKKSGADALCSYLEVLTGAA